MRILVVEDEADLNLLLCKVLTKAGYTVDGCLDGEDAQAHLLGAAYDGILLDVMLPKKDGYTLVQELRDQGNDTPVLFLTARDSVADRVKGLDLGGDDYLVKPFDFAELLARIRAMTRKRVGQRTNQFTVGDLTLDTERRQAVRGGEEIPLLPKEFSILEYLVRNKEKVLSREQIEDQIWNYDYAGSSNNVDVYLSRLRKKIDGGREEKLIHTVRGWAGPSGSLRPRKEGPGEKAQRQGQDYPLVSAADGSDGRPDAGLSPADQRFCVHPKRHGAAGPDGAGEPGAGDPCGRAAPDGGGVPVL